MYNMRVYLISFQRNVIDLFLHIYENKCLKGIIYANIILPSTFLFFFTGKISLLYLLFFKFISNMKEQFNVYKCDIDL